MSVPIKKIKSDCGFETTIVGGIDLFNESYKIASPYSSRLEFICFGKQVGVYLPGEIEERVVRPKPYISNGFKSINLLNKPL